MLELPVLGLLKERAMHGYELRKQLGTMLGPFWQVSWGSLYPTLRRLAKAGAVEKVVEPVPAKPRRSARAAAGGGASTAVSPGRRKTVYRVTEIGDQMFKDMLEETVAAVDADHFTLKLAFFRYLAPEARLSLLERRRAYLTEKLAQFRNNMREISGRIDSYTLSLQNHSMASTESDIRWIEELITEERRASAAPGDLSKA